MEGEILVLPFYGQGHLFPCLELCNELTSFSFKSTLIIPSHLSSSIPANLRHHSLIQLVEISTTKSTPPQKVIQIPKGKDGRNFMQGPFSSITITNSPICVVVDVMMSWNKEIFMKFDIPVVSFFTSAWKNHVDDMKHGEIQILPGLPESMALSYSDIKQNHRGPSHHCNGGPSSPSQKPRWLDEIEGSIELLINTWYDLESPFINYVINQIEKKIWGVGPLLPETFRKSQLQYDMIMKSEVANCLKMGHMILLSDEPREMVKKEDIQRVALRSIFQNGYPDSSMCSLKSFIQFISK
ncbi:hypothetical protein R3W88_021180 [Solanum pinnatisectum]|uniref:Uncharacterized protein n=1 Tax=Solanum pinnatisectum TaxID=50273 RepID=A0AAV9LSK4_9SOLN|nr:hypothetical protein R3W88_021180 [Solanum pinnatisectum]